MLLCSRNLWMRPAVLEAPAQDPQYLEAIHKVCWQQGAGARRGGAGGGCWHISAPDTTGCLDSMQTADLHWQCPGTGHTLACAAHVTQTCLLCAYVVSNSVYACLFLLFLHPQLVDRCPYVVCFMSALEKSCSLHQLVHYQHKLQQLQQHVLQSNTLAAREALCDCPSLVKVRLQGASTCTATTLAAGLVAVCCSYFPTCTRPPPHTG
jgi:hypothetical protein